MTKRQIIEVLNIHFYKYKVIENQNYHTLTFRVDRPLTYDILSDFENVRPAGVPFYFHTMGFFERLFTFSNSYKIIK